jgi:hypothetical protein
MLAKTCVWRILADAPRRRYAFASAIFGTASARLYRSLPALQTASGFPTRPVQPLPRVAGNCRALSIEIKVRDPWSWPERPMPRIAATAKKADVIPARHEGQNTGDGKAGISRLLSLASPRWNRPRLGGS